MKYLRCTDLDPAIATPWWHLRAWPLLRKILRTLRLVRPRIYGFRFGRPITNMGVWHDGEWRFPEWRFDSDWSERTGPDWWACPRCHEHETEDGHDPCIANLPGVRFACCGHGVEGGYLMLEDRTAIYGDFGFIGGPLGGYFNVRNGDEDEWVKAALWRGYPSYQIDLSRPQDTQQ